MPNKRKRHAKKVSNKKPKAVKTSSSKSQTKKAVAKGLVAKKTASMLEAHAAPLKGETKRISEMLANVPKPKDIEPIVLVDEDEEEAYSLIKPVNKKSSWWSHYMVFHPKHSEMQDYAQCKYCPHRSKITQGTGGLSTHLQFKHREIYETAMGIGVENHVKMCAFFASTTMC